MTSELLHAGTIAYFSMDVAVDTNIPTYSGGLGVLAGDMLRSAADLKLPMVAVSLLHRKGYFDQRLDSHGNQTESPVKWSPERHLKRLAEQVTVTIGGRPVQIGAWQYLFPGVTGHTVPLIFLDTDLAENDSSERGLTHGKITSTPFGLMSGTGTQREGYFENLEMAHANLLGMV
jgi:starch phosphorylase